MPNRTSLAQVPVIAAGSEKQSASAGGMAAMIELGEVIVENTSKHPLSKEFVGNSLNCTSCHLDNGGHEKAASFVGIATAYPAWSPRENRVITLQDRVLNCFMRSENGTRPPIGSKVATAITTYITSLSEGQPIKMIQRSIEWLRCVADSIAQNEANTKHDFIKFSCGKFATVLFIKNLGS